MNTEIIKQRGMVLMGCGKMGSAMLQGWLNAGIPSNAVWVQDPQPSDWLQGLDGLNLNADLPKEPAIVLIAVKPQTLQSALPVLRPMGNGSTLFLTVAAGASIASYETALGAQTPIIRAMPNTPAAIGQGITALIGNAISTGADMQLAENLLATIGQTVRLSSEAQMDAVTGVSGSGPAYVFHLIETLSDAGVAQGLPEELALQLAKATVAGAGALALSSDQTPGQLRENVTSPNGTTAAALQVLMDSETGFPALLNRAVTAATKRSKELGT